MEDKDLYGLFLVKLDRIGSRDQYVLAYGNKRKVQLYKEEFNLKGQVKEYKTKKWLVKRLETIKGIYKDRVKILYIE